MTTYMEEIAADIAAKKSFIADDVQIRFKRSYAYIRFFFSEGTTSDWNKIKITELQKIARYMEGSVHSCLRNAALYN